MLATISLEGKRMNRTLGRIAGSMTAVVTLCGLSAAQEPGQHWQATQNYPFNNGPNYQPSAPAGQNQPAQQAAAGQQQYPQYPPPGTSDYRRPSDPPPAGPAQTYPQYPIVQGPAGQGPAAVAQPAQNQPQRPIAPKLPPLSPQQLAKLDNLLNDWEMRNKQIQVLESKFFRWKYDSVFHGPSNSPPPKPDEGELKFAAPDKAWMKIEAKDPAQSEQWLCDGKSVYQWDYKQKAVMEWMLPPDLQGKGIGEGPLPFVFGIEAQKLKQRYYMQIITPPNVQNEVWLEAYPRFQHDAANYSKVQVILQVVGPARTLFPYAIQVYAPNEKDRTVYQLQDPQINPRRLIRDIFGTDWTKPSIERGWTKRTETPEAPANQSGANAAMPPRR
jgi:TIGR03009 family protein